MSTLEENSGDGGNSSISELEVRVESLENATTDQETRLSAAETSIEGIGTHLSQTMIYVSRLRACGPVVPGIPRFGRSGSG